jgi:hypothetical protein
MAHAWMIDPKNDHVHPDESGCNDTMQCLACGGRLQRELIAEPVENDAQFYLAWWSGYRCCACGKLNEPIHGPGTLQVPPSSSSAAGYPMMQPLLLTREKLIEWHHLSRERHTAKEQRACAVCRCQDGVVPWESLITLFDRCEVKHIRFESPCFVVPNPVGDLADRLYHLVAGQGPWV